MTSGSEASVRKASNAVQKHSWQPREKSSILNEGAFSPRSRRNSSAIEVLPLLFRPTISVVRSSKPTATSRRRRKFSISTPLIRISLPFLSFPLRWLWR